MLTDKGYQDLKRAIAACTLSNLSLLLPAMVMLRAMMELLRPFSNEEISWTNLWICFAAGIAAAVICFLCHKNDYRKTYVVSYQESEKTRTTLAEHIRKLPMSVFNSKDLSELTTNMMGDVSTSEHVLSHVYPQLFSNAISITLICIMMAFFDWRMALAIYITVPLALLVVILGRSLQLRLSKKHVAAKLAASEQVQEYIEGLKVIKACNMDGDKFSALERSLRTMKTLAIKVELGSGVFVTGAQVVLQAGIGLTVFTGVTLLSSGQIGLIPMLLSLLVVTRIYAPVQTVLTLLPELLYHQVSIKRMRALMDYEPMEGNETPLENFDIQFDSVNFHYNEGGEETIRRISTTIPADSITALVGPPAAARARSHA